MKGEEKNCRKHAKQMLISFKNWGKCDTTNNGGTKDLPENASLKYSVVSLSSPQIPCHVSVAFIDSCPAPSRLQPHPSGRRHVGNSK